eukprot:m.39487 g.39487  ORF g.39487 m.39487 type:complete len:341 (-) comp18212_c0_seq1:204-1226(-)
MIMSKPKLSEMYRERKLHFVDLRSSAQKSTEKLLLLQTISKELAVMMTYCTEEVDRLRTVVDVVTNDDGTQPTADFKSPFSTALQKRESKLESLCTQTKYQANMLVELQEKRHHDTMAAAFRLQSVAKSSALMKSRQPNSRALTTSSIRVLQCDLLRKWHAALSDSLAQTKGGPTIDNTASPFSLVTPDMVCMWVQLSSILPKPVAVTTDDHTDRKPYIEKLSFGTRHNQTTAIISIFASRAQSQSHCWNYQLECDLPIVLPPTYQLWFENKNSIVRIVTQLIWPMLMALSYTNVTTNNTIATTNSDIAHDSNGSSSTSRVQAISTDAISTPPPATTPSQ